MQKVDITQEFTLPVERVYAYLAEHENLGALFGAAITRVQDGDTSRNGVGSVRSLKVGPLPSFQETVTEAIPNETIVYRITQGSPLKDHRGCMTFTSTPSGSRLHYVIEFGSKVPGVDRLVKIGLDRNVRNGLKTVDATA